MRRGFFEDKECSMKDLTQRRAGQAGSAFVISILVLFVLTALGLALMLTSTTEADISTNYRWGEMAFFNADAGLEYAKNVLAGYVISDTDFRNALPPPRGPGNMNAPPEPPVGRNYQYSIVQGPVTMYIGKVLRDRAAGRDLVYDFRNPVGNDVRGDLNLDGRDDVQGTVTVWVRRPIVGDEDYGFSNNKHDRVIITAEGTAPNYEAAPTGRPTAMRRLEMSVRVLTGEVSDTYAQPGKGSDNQIGARAVGTANRTATVAPR
jgi:hypothetical protein